MLTGVARACRGFLLVAAALSLLPLTAAGQSILARRYTSDKLDGFWQGTLGATAPDPARLAILAPGPDAPEPVRPAPALPDFGLPFEGEIIGESAGQGGATVARAFPVIPMSPDDAAVLNRRLAWSEIYLNRYRYFEPVSTDTADTLGALTARQSAAGLEAYLVTARLYFAADNLPEKCRRLTRMAELAAGPLAGLDAAAPPEGWQPLVPLMRATETRLGDDALAALACAVEPVRGRAETARLVETRVRERIMQEVRAKVEDTLRLLEAASAEFQALVNQMDVPIASAEIMEFERVLGNASANMLLVKEDRLKAKDTIATLKAVDLSTLNQPGELREFEDGAARMTAMVGLIDEVLAALADLAAVGDPAIAAELAPCATLRGAYGALDLSRDSGTLAREIGQPYEDCLARARAVVARFQEPSLAKAQMAALARHVRQISETYLSTVAP